MFKLDNLLIQDKFNAASFSFYTDKEIELLSVKNVKNPTAFDHLNNPTEYGIYDKTMGVSPFAHRQLCITCGLDEQFCPGHVGHIELTAPVYNPFLIGYLYKLLKSKCFHCHRLRIHPSKILIYVMCLKLIKSGEIVASANLKQQFLHAAKNISLINEQTLDNPKKLQNIKNGIDKIQLKDSKNKDIIESQFVTDSLTNYFKAIQEKFNDSHQQYQDELNSIFDQINNETNGEIPFNQKHDYVNHTSLEQKQLKELLHEIWASVITTTCPHCKGKSPSIRKDGFTKFFQKPLSDKAKNAMKQQERLQSSKKLVSQKKIYFGKESIDIQSEGTVSQIVKDDTFEIGTSISTGIGNINSRKESSNSRSHVYSSHQEDDECEGNKNNEDNEIQYDYQESEDDDNNNDEQKQGNVSKQKYMTPLEVKEHIERLWSKEKELLGLMFGRYYPQLNTVQQQGENVEQSYHYKTDTLGTQMFFMQKLLVPPNRFRPESQGAFGGRGETTDRSFLHAHSAMLTKILVANLQLKDALLEQAKNTSESQIQQFDRSGLNDMSLQQKQNEDGSSDVVQKWIQLQDAINIFVDSSMAMKVNDKEQSGIRQLLERKEGMFRMKMMGKRVNFGARSVISPDPYITTDQIGVPIFMAKKLTFPESVSDVNYDRLKKMVINGPFNHPGANIVEDEDTNQRTYLEALTLQQRKGLAKRLKVGRQVVYRHLSTGDVLLVNRQPTLHKPSIMAHIARILPKEQTIRMHYSNCSTYNADFDGDEMNLHFPQSFQAQSEAKNIMATHKQYIVPTSGKPIRGLIQDSVVSGVYLSSKDTFLTKEVYQQLVYVGLREFLEDSKITKIITLQPCILKPRPLYTGKQVISTILKNIVHEENQQKRDKIRGMNLDSKAKLPAKEWGPLGIEEGDVVFRDNELLQGTIDKAQFGASEFGMVHSFYEIYGSEKAGELLTSLGRIFTMYLQLHGFTCGLDDLVLTPEFNKKRRTLIEQSHREGIEAAAEFCGIKKYKCKDFNYSNRIVFQRNKKMGLDYDQDIDQYNQMGIPDDPFNQKQTIQMGDPIRKRLQDKFNLVDDIQKLDTEFDNVIKSKVNNATSQLLKLCIPDGLVKRFPKNNISSMVLTGAKGGFVNQTQITCMLGQQELEGKRVPKMQNGKTLPCFLPYDPNPRSSGYISDRFIDGLRPQDFFFHCMAGREGLIDTAVKTSRSGYLQRCLIKQLESLIVQYDMTVRDNDGSIIQFQYGEDGIDVIHNKFIDKFNFLEQNFTSLMLPYIGKDITKKMDTKRAEQMKHQQKKKIKKLHQEQPNLTKEQLKQYQDDPVLSQLHPLKYFGSISEKMDEKLKQYLKHDCMSKVQEKQGINKILKTKFNPIQEKTFMQMYYLKYMSSVVQPGENVGTIASQSIGEPSTQMTLNTFHLAGHGAENMTLGIPRLKEILMTAPVNIKTPNMTIYFRKDRQISKDRQEQFANKFKRLKLQDIIKQVTVNQSIIKSSSLQSQNSTDEYSRLYSVTLEIEDYTKITTSLGLKFSDIMSVFKSKYVPTLVSETLKQMKKTVAAQGTINEQDKLLLSRLTPSKSQKEDMHYKDGVRVRGKGKQKKSEQDGQQEFNDDNDNELYKIDSVIDIQKSNNKNKDNDDDSIEEEVNYQQQYNIYQYQQEDKEINYEIDGAIKKNRVASKGDYEQESDDDIDINKKVLINVNEDDRDDDNKDDEQYIEIDNQKITKNKNDQQGNEDEYVKGMVFDKNKSLQVNIAFPLDFKKVLMITIAENTLQNVLLRSIKGIEKCTLITPTKQDEEPFLIVQGINFGAFCKYPDVIDVKRMQSNDIIQINKKYGIEAARALIVKEVRSVFNMYGIEVNYRHLNLVSDFITFNGDYRPFNRIGMEESSSPFLKMSFETTMKYLIGSCMTKDTDNISTPSSALVLGQIPKIGTGIFDIVQEGE